MTGNSKLIGRAPEIEQLQRAMDSDRSEFVIVYGRRRVGKTFLVEQFFEGSYDFSYVGGHRLSKAKQLRGFSRALKKYAHLKSQPSLTSWDDAFEALEDHLETLPRDKRKVIFIDEMPWIDTLQSDFVEALETFWNGWAARRDDIVLVASGSATSWMVDKLVENPGGLHGRITCSIYVRPFTLGEVEQYLHSRGARWDKYQIMQAYMIIGGIPFYYTLLNVKKSLVQNIDELFFKPGGALRVEFDELYNALFLHADKYIAVVKALNDVKSGLTRGEIGKATGLSGTTLSVVLRNLVRCDFVNRFSQYGNKRNGELYRLVDFYSLFYLKFITAATEQDEQWWSHNHRSHSVEAWQGFSFELIALTHLNQIKRALGISGIAAGAFSWRYTPKTGIGAQIDLVIERGDRIINLCEIKFATLPYRISSPYELTLLNRMEIFKTATRTTKALSNTFITTFGIADGKYRSIVDNEVTMNDLFVL